MNGNEWNLLQTLATYTPDSLLQAAFCSITCIDETRTLLNQTGFNAFALAKQRTKRSWMALSNRFEQYLNSWEFGLSRTEQRKSVDKLHVVQIFLLARRTMSLWLQSKAAFEALIWQTLQVYHPHSHLVEQARFFLFFTVFPAVLSTSGDPCQPRSRQVAAAMFFASCHHVVKKKSVALHTFQYFPVVSGLRTSTSTCTQRVNISMNSCKDFQ